MYYICNLNCKNDRFVGVRYRFFDLINFYFNITL